MLQQDGAPGEMPQTCHVAHQGVGAVKQLVAICEAQQLQALLNWCIQWDKLAVHLPQQQPAALLQASP